MSDNIFSKNLESIHPKVTDYHYTFNHHFHSFIGSFIEKINKGELQDFLSIETQQQRTSFFENEYTINSSDPRLFVHYFDKKVDFQVEGAYSIYNWELFYFIPLAIAVQLTKNQRFSDAQRWFHYIFNPLTNEAEDLTNPTARFWNFLPFRENADAHRITELLENLSLPNSDDATLNLLKERMQKNIAAWRKFPFSAHEVAKFRPHAYQFNVVMQYLDMLIAWGDNLFRQFSIETNNLATQKYIIAKNLLGPRPQKVPKLSKRPIRNYRQLKNKLDEFGNALIEMESEFPLNINVSTQTNNQDPSLTSLLGIGKQLFFCIPHNKQLLKYWDLVEDRLFKIRNCMDIEGNIRQLPLFQPPINPGMLIAAAAGGLSISDIVGGLNQPVSNVRFNIILQKAMELTNEVRSMGNALLSAIEKGENEKLSLIRQGHEIRILELTQDFKYLQWKEAETSTESLLKSRESAFQRYRHFQLLLGKNEGDIADLASISLVRPNLTEDNFEEVYSNMVSRYGQQIDLEVYRDEKLGLLGEVTSRVSRFKGFSKSKLGIGGSENLQLNKMEDMELNVFMPLATGLSTKSGGVGAASGLLALVPQFGIKFEPLGVGGDATFGGKQLSAMTSFASQLIRLSSEIISYQGTRASKLAAYHRRIGDWVNGNNLASKELEQIGKQIITSLIREQSLKKDYENHKVQIEQSKAIDEFIRIQKFSNDKLYLWMQGELSKVYFECYKLAFDTAKKAEATLKHELMRKELDERTFIKFNYWDAGRKGLLSGEGLYLDLKRMELAYLENNKREFELTKHISIQRLAPFALLSLKATGSCTIDTPEWLFDLDCPGHYHRRLKTVSLSMPTVTGPYTSINCTLTLEKSTIRKSALLADDVYERNPDGDDRFNDYFGATQSIVTSNGQNDSGLFDANQRDERFLPFENSGAISTWRLELPSELRQIDYQKITDVILHIRYTARQGGQLFGGAATKFIKEELMPNAANSGLVRMFNLKQDFPNEWHQFNTSTEATPQFKAIIKRSHFNYLSQVGAFDNIQMQKFTIDKENNLSESMSITTPENFLNQLNDNSESEINFDIPDEDKEKNIFLIVKYAITI